jgi:hypothetical protein
MPISQIVTNSIANGAIIAADIASGQTLSLNGITFPATQVPSTNVNTLDDYEEGSWTPIFNAEGSSPTVTYSFQIGRYVKIGKLVVASGRVIITGRSGGSGNLFVGGFPFAGEDVDNSQCATQEYYDFASWSSGYQVNSLFIPLTNGLNLIFNGSAGRLNLTPSNLQNGTGYSFTLCYRAAA